MNIYLIKQKNIYFKLIVLLISFSLIKSIDEDYRNNLFKQNSTEAQIKKEEKKNYIEKSIIKNSTEIINIDEKELKEYTYLTLEVIPNYGKIKVNVSFENENEKCKNDSNINSEIIKSYKSYFYTYINDSRSNNSYPKQIIIKCEEGLTNITNEICIVKYIIYTENDEINMDDSNIKYLPLFKYISENNTNKYYFKQKEEPHYLNIEIFSGNISLHFNSYIKPILDYGNKKLYELKGYNNFTLNITGIEDSFYSIYDYTEMYLNNNYFIVGLGHFLNKSHDRNASLLDYYYYYEQNESIYYIGIFSQKESGINFSLKDAKSQNIKEISENCGLRQIILSSNFYYEFIINYNNEEKNNNYDYIICYQLDNITGISLTNGISQPFLFNQTYNYLIFSYPHTQKEKDVNITFNLNNKEKQFLIKIKLNDYEYNNNNTIPNLYTLSKNETIISINSNDIKKNCNNFIHICKIFLYVQSIDNQEDSLLYINVNKKKEENGIDGKDRIDRIDGIENIIILIFLIIFLIGLFIMMILIILNILKMIFIREDLLVKIDGELGAKEFQLMSEKEY